MNRQPPTFLEKHTRLQDRLRNLRLALQRQRRSRNGTKLRLRITRENVLADSFSHLRGVDGTLVASLPLSVQFDGEEGLDQGGVSREWMFLLMQAVLDPQVALFSKSNENYVYQINASSHVNPEHLDYFNFLGKLLAKCICDGITTPFSHFTPDVYNVLLQKPTYFSDLQIIDADIYRSLQWILDNDVEELGLTFVADEEEFGMIRQVELKEGGKDIKVTEENKREFVELKAKYSMVDRKIEQLKAVSEMHLLCPFCLQTVLCCPYCWPVESNGALNCSSLKALTAYLRWSTWLSSTLRSWNSCCVDCQQSTWKTGRRTSNTDLGTAQAML